MKIYKLMLLSAVAVSLSACGKRDGEEDQMRRAKENIRIELSDEWEISDFEIEVKEKSSGSVRIMVTPLASSKEDRFNSVVGTSNPQVLNPKLKAGESRKGRSVEVIGYKAGKGWDWRQEIPDYFFYDYGAPKKRFAPDAVVSGSPEHAAAIKEKNRLTELRRAELEIRRQALKKESISGLESLKIGDQGRGEILETGTDRGRMHLIEVIDIIGAGADRSVIMTIREDRLRPNVAKFALKLGADRWPILYLDRVEGQIYKSLLSNNVTLLNGYLKINGSEAVTTTTGIKMESKTH